MTNSSVDKQTITWNDDLLSAMKGIMRKEGIRVTKQRVLILEAIASQIVWHVHSKEIYKYVKTRDPNIGLATLYRNLRMFEDMNLIDKVHMFAQMDMHTLNNKRKDHYHMICLKCGKIHEVNNDISSSLKTFALKNGFMVERCRLILFGKCEECIDLNI